MLLIWCDHAPGHTCSVSARPEFLGVIDDPLFENLGVIEKFRGSELVLFIITFLFVCACIDIKGI